MYNGFSTIDKSSRNFVLKDKKLIKRDLLNALNIRLGSVVMQPTVGCLIWQYLFGQLTQTAAADITANLTSIVNNDPRINLQSIDISQVENGITITMIILYVLTNEVETMKVNFNAQNESAAYY